MSASVPQARGRPREFCTDKALAAALQVFWSKGYDATSLSDLTAAMGITRPSLYAAFGNKEALFHEALDLYQRDKLRYIEQAIEQPTAAQVAERLLRGAYETAAGEGESRGCMGVIASTSCGEDTQGVRDDVQRRGKVVRTKLVERFDKARQEGDLPANADSDGLTSFLFALVQGISLQARAGASREQLKALTTVGVGSFSAYISSGC
ncbi:TetR/AcrR family transcriptional regulator [Sphingomonas sp. LHG3406-1]|uniref:TetR/AcrR family transcriptional regulator n=1 Tax=Sphingomonas sp. LHG3406-1 TaxID=2804617 RepID=UPI002623AB19|nr:TetR/AcrR family transcriptional regulator [Sphingomonas sp. LHG3406-1]